jgi:uncharacterized membrane protein YfcA
MTALVGMAIGLLGGFFGGLVGLGGGVVMIPLMTAWPKLTQHKAHGTSLVAIVFIGFFSAAAYFIHGMVDWRVALLLAATAIITVRLGALYAHSLPEKRLKKAFGGFLIFVSLVLLAKGYFSGTGGFSGFWLQIAIFLVTGAFTGFISGMMGVGGGTIMIPPMVILAGMTQQMAQGTSLLAMVPIGITGAVTHYRLGNVQTNIALGLAAGGIVGGYLGGTTANLLPELLLKIIFAGVLIWMGIRYLRS